MRLIDAEIQKILDYLDNELHPLVSPDHWNVYSELYDMVSELKNLPPSPTVTADPDTVSRQDARMCLTGDVTDMSIEQYIKMVDKRLEQLPPSPTPSRPKGHWIRWYETLEDANCVEHIPKCKCSECGTEYDPHSSQFINFCSHCGADMRGGAV